MYRHKITNPKKEDYDRTEILRTDFRLQDRIDGIVGMVVEELFVKSDSFTMICSDKKNGRGMRIQVSKSHYGDYNMAYLKLSAVEIIYKSEQEKEEWRKKEEARGEKLSKKWFDKHGTAHPQYGLPKDWQGSQSSFSKIQKIVETLLKHDPRQKMRQLSLQLAS